MVTVLIYRTAAPTFYDVSETKRYQGSCHCGKVQYEVDLDLSQPVITCNCSMCGRSGTMLAFVPASAFTLKSGDQDLRAYRFNSKTIDHLFCVTCGIKPFARGQMPDGAPTAAVNVRCIEGVELDDLEVQKFNGRSS